MKTCLLDLSAKDILERTQLAYLFRHVMTREVAYESLLYAERRDLHGKIARSIEAQQGARLDEYVEVLAEHCTLAEDWPGALTYHLKAGRRAQSVFANQDAIHRYQKALEVAQHVPESLSEQLAAHEGLGDTYQLVGRYDESLGSYAQARAVLDQMPSSPDVEYHRADLCRKTGHIHEYRGEYDQALLWIEQGLRLMEAKEHIETARLYLGGAAVFQREGQWQEVILWCRLSLDIAEKLTTQEAQQVAAHAYYLLGNSYHRLGETEKAGLYYHRSLDTYQALEDSPGMARAYNNLATFYFYQDDWTRATEYYQQALATLERVGDLHGQAVIANNLGGVLSNRGQLDHARAWYQRSLDISQELGLSFGVALVYNNLGYAFIRAQEWDQALSYLQQSLEMFERIGAEEFLPELERHLAEAHLGRGDADEALTWAEKSLERALAAETKLEEGCTRRVLGSVHLARGQTPEAEAQLQHSIRILEGLASSYEVARSVIQLAALYADQGDEIQATRLRQQAIATFERLGAELDLARATSFGHRRFAH